MELCAESGLFSPRWSCRVSVRVDRQYRWLRLVENGRGDRDQLCLLSAGHDLGENQTSCRDADDSQDPRVYLDDRDGAGAAERLKF